MSISLLFSFFLAAGLFVFGGLFIVEGESGFFDLETFIFLFVLVSEMILFLILARNFSFVLVLVLVYYFFLRYILAGISFFLLSHYGQDTWMFADYSSWLTSSQINTALCHAVLGFPALALGINVGSGLLLREHDRNCQSNFLEDAVEPHMGSFFLVFLIYIVVAVLIQLKVGYGSSSGIDSTGGDNLYNLFSPFHFAYSLIAWGVFSENLGWKDRWLFVAMLVGCIGFSVFIGLRRSMYDFVLYWIIMTAAQKGSFHVKSKHIVAGVLILACAIPLYPIGKMMKQMWKSWGTLNAKSITQNIEELHRFRDQSLSDFRLLFLETVDRLADPTAPITIINDRFLNPVDEQINLINTFKRALNDMIPGTVFHDMIPANILYEYIYRGSIYVYGGEEWGILGVYYTHFGYVGSLLALFLTSYSFAFLYRKAILFQCWLKPIFLMYFLILYMRFIYNNSLEYWVASVLFATGLRFFIIALFLWALFYLMELGRELIVIASSRTEYHLNDLER